jgi:hypothetical protein
VAVLDAIRETRPPFSPEATVRAYADVLKSYGLHRVTGDRYAGEWPREQFRKLGIEYIVATKAKSEIYRDALAMLNSGRVEVLDHPRLIAQLTGLERRTARGGRDTIDHAPSAHDDLANAALGALILGRAHHDIRIDAAALAANDSLRRPSLWGGFDAPSDALPVRDYYEG